MSENHADVSGEKNYFYGKRFYGEQNPFYGKTHTDETKRKIGECHRGIPLTEEHKRKISEGSVSKVKVINILSGEIFNSITEFILKTNLKDEMLNKEYSEFIRYREYLLLTDEDIQKRLYTIKHRDDKNIVRLKDDKIYKRLSVCCRENNINKNVLYKHLKNKLRNETPEYMYYKDWLDLKENE